MAKSKKQVETQEDSEIESGLEEETPELKEVTEDADGNQFMPGMGPIVIEELVLLVRDIEKVHKKNFATARDTLVHAKEQLAELSHKHIEHFTPNPQKEHQLVYKAGGVTVTITQTEEKIGTKLDDLDEDEE